MKNYEVSFLKYWLGSKIFKAVFFFLNFSIRTIGLKLPSLIKISNFWVSEIYLFEKIRGVNLKRVDLGNRFFNPRQFNPSPQPRITPPTNTPKNAYAKFNWLLFSDFKYFIKHMYFVSIISSRSGFEKLSMSKNSSTILIFFFWKFKCVKCWKFILH